MRLKHYLILFSLILFMQEIILPQSIIILTSDRQLDDLQDPDKKIDMSLGLEKNINSLRGVCEAAKQRKETTLTIAFDEFFRQYREQEGTERKLTPVMDEYINKLKSVSDFAKQYGLGIGLSLLSPLEIGPAFAKETGEYGRWVRYAAGLREPKSGKFEVQLWRELFWTNNKGKFALKLKGIKAYAFKEKDIANGRYTVVLPEDIHEIKSGVELEEWPDTTVIPKWIPTSIKHDVSVPIRRVRIYSNGSEELKGYDRVFVMLEYETPEMDYFSPKALPFLKNVMKKYSDTGINLVSLYSDEMHLQQDWHYHNHHENGQFGNRYMTDNFAKRYSEKYGSEYRDMDKYMLYFLYGQKSYNRSPYAILNSQYVMGETYEDISKTILFRDRYYKMLNNEVVDLFKGAKDYAESLFKCELLTLAHASWAESPTIDLWETGELSKQAYQYEYTPNFLWSNTVQQAAAACYDYFKWGEYLQPTGNDFAECGWSDRDYYGSAMAASIGILNKYPNAYAAFWGMPRVAERWKYSLVSAFGAAGTPTMDAITGHVHRDVDVLILYPMNLVAAEERFGSWITQYAYCNYITAEKLLEVGKITSDGKIEIAGRKFSTLISLFEITPAKGLLDFINDFNKAGGRLLWFGTPALMEGDGTNCLDKWENIFGVDYQPSAWMGQGAAGKIVDFENNFSKVPSQVILTDFLVDRIHPVTLRANSKVTATSDGMTLGSITNNGKGIACYFGFRPRDDQSASLGYETRTLFEILNAANAYPATGKFSGVNDNTEYVSRTTNYLTTRFPNGSTAIVTHYRTHREGWADGFSRDDAADSVVLLTNPMPSDKMELSNFKVNGHEIDFEGRQLCAFNKDVNGKLVSFEGHDCDRVEIDKTLYILSSKKQKMISWSPVTDTEMKDYNSLLKIWVDASGKINIPVTFTAKEVKFAKVDYGNISYLEKVSYQVKDNVLTIDVNPELSGRWIYICK
jgi:hypothetical protein